MLTQTARACASIHLAPGHEHSCLKRSRGGECGSMKRGAGAEKHRRGGGQSKTRRENKEEGDRGFPEGTAVPFFPCTTETPHGPLRVQGRPSAQPPAGLRPPPPHPNQDVLGPTRSCCPCWSFLSSCCCHVSIPRAEAEHPTCPPETSPGAPASPWMPPSNQVQPGSHLQHSHHHTSKTPAKLTTSGSPPPGLG